MSSPIGALGRSGKLVHPYLNAPPLPSGGGGSFLRLDSAPADAKSEGMFAGPNRHTLYMHDVPLLCECKDCGRKAAADCGARGIMTPLRYIRVVCSHCGSRNVWRGMAHNKARTEEWLAGDLSRAKLEPPHEDALSRGVKD